MIFRVLKSEDIIFVTKEGKRLFHLKEVDTDKIAEIEGASEYSVLQLERDGETYLLREEFKVEASIDTLDDFIEEYDEEDDATEEPTEEMIAFEEEIQQEELDKFEENTILEITKSKNSEDNIKDIEDIPKDIENSDRDILKSSHIFLSPEYVKEVYSTEHNINEQVEARDTTVVYTDEVYTNISDNSSEISDETSNNSDNTIDETRVNEEIQMRILTQTPLPRLETVVSNIGVANNNTNTQIEQNIPSQITNNTIEETTTVITNNSNSILEDTTQTEEDTPTATTDNSILEDTTQTEEENNPTTTDNSTTEDTTTTEDEIPPSTDNDTSDDTTTDEDTSSETTAIEHLTSKSLEIGDLTALGIVGIDDNDTTISQLNNILADSDISVNNAQELQSITDILVKVVTKDGDNTATDLTKSEWELLGINNLSTPDANELNIAIADPDSLDLGTNIQTNLQTIEDSLNALDEVKYGNSTGVELTDLTNIGVTGVGGEDEPTLEAVNHVLYDTDVDADDTNTIQAIVNSLTTLNLTNANSATLSLMDLETLGVRASDGVVSNDELRYINNRIAENSSSNTQGDGDFANDVAELQALLDNIDSGTFHFGDSGTDSFNYSDFELYDGGEGVDLVYVNGGDSVKIEDLHNIESIVLNADNSSNDTDLASALGDITIQDVIDITDGGNVLTIDENDGASNDTVERVFLDSNDFQTDGVLDAEGYYNYIATDGSGVTVRIEELIVVEG